MKPELHFPIVGIGASAGGLAAFDAFFSAFSSNSPLNQEGLGMAFVIVQHLDPNHKSILAELISRYTTMRVSEATDGEKLRPNCVYIIPPNHDMACLLGTLHLLPPANPHGHRLPIDFFLRSLAQDQRERAICIILSGSGSDGALGLRAIKGEGGMAMVQEPSTGDFDGMPRSAISTGLADYILPPQQMPAQLAAFAAQAYRLPNLATSTPAKTPVLTSEILAKVCVLVRSATGHDFSGYKPTTITRRIERRLAVHNIENSLDYLHYLQQTPAEVEALFRDFLIGVTQFFREPETFQALEEEVLAQIFASKAPGSPIRVWVPGCSTGEEAYSIAILLQERLELLQKSYQLQVFATDIDRNAIATARSGLYPANVAQDIGSTRLARYFVAEPAGGAYRVTKVIRDMLIFSEHDLTRDPPFSRLDLISCRNLFIYLGLDLQKKLIPLFHYALNPAGYLASGTSESVGEFSNLFSVLDKKFKLYQRIADKNVVRQAVRSHYRPPTLPGESSLRLAAKPTPESALSLRELVERMLIQQYAPACALVTQSGEICYLHGRTGLYLEPVEGEASLNILKMAREGLRRELSLALHSAATRQEAIRSSNLSVRSNGHYTNIDLEVRPVDLISSGILGKGLLLVLFEAKREAALSPPPIPVLASLATSPPELGQDATHAQIHALQQELRAKDEYLKSILEQIATSGEELRSSNEEMQSINEELQSANEELETSKEEIQSVNEELSTVNTELNQRVTDLSRANNDMNNLMAGTGIGTIFVDHQLRIQRFTPAATQTINLIPSDIGRPVGHIASNLLGYDSLVADIGSVLSDLQPKKIEVETQSHLWYLLRIRPYRTLENVIEGVVITFFEITEMKRSREAQLRSEARIEQMTASLPDLVWTFDAEGICDHLSPQWLDYTGVALTAQLGLGWLKQLHAEDRDQVFAAWNRSIGTATVLSTEFRLRGRDGQYRHFRSRVTPVFDQQSRVLRWFGSNTDIEPEKQAEAALRLSQAQRKALSVALPVGLLFQNAEGIIVEANPAAEEILGQSASSLMKLSSGEWLKGAISAHGELFDWEASAINSSRVTGLVSTEPLISLRSLGGGTNIWLKVTAIPVCATLPDNVSQLAPYCVYLLLQPMKTAGENG